MATQEKCVEAKKESNSMHEEKKLCVEKTHDMVERRLVGPYGQRPTLTDGARPSKSVASSHESHAGSARDRTDRRGRKGEMGARDNGEKRKQHLARCLPLSNHNSTTFTHVCEHCKLFPVGDFSWWVGAHCASGWWCGAESHTTGGTQDACLRCRVDSRLEVKGLTESSKRWTTRELLSQWKSCVNHRGAEVYEMVLPKFNKEYMCDRR